MVNSRPGGRTARTKAAVFKAAAGLLAERGPGSLTMTDIAERAGVAVTTLYRRWGDVGVLLLEVAVEYLVRERPLPDTGSLRGDLRSWARRIAVDLRSKEGSALFRVIVAHADRSRGRASSRLRALDPRLRQIEVMLDRARRRGDPAPSALEVIEHLLAPLYFRALFGIPGTKAFANHLADRLIPLGDPPALSGRQPEFGRSGNQHLPEFHRFDKTPPLNSPPPLLSSPPERGKRGEGVKG